MWPRTAARASQRLRGAAARTRPAIAAAAGYLPGRLPPADWSQAASLSSSPSSSSTSPPPLPRSTSVADRIAARVAERDSWPTWRSVSPADVFKFATYQPRQPWPSQAELDEHFPVLTPDFNALANPPRDRMQLTWFGHATVLCQVGGVNILTDPVLCSRASPFQFMGPERFRRPPCSLADLRAHGVGVDLCLISHNHYDHLDVHAVSELARDFDTHFVVPLGLRKWFESRLLGMHPAGGGFLHGSGHRLTELDWWEGTAPPLPALGGVGGGDGSGDVAIKVTSVPMQHWSSRFGFDRDATLWCGFVVEASQQQEKQQEKQQQQQPEQQPHEPQRFLFTGDTGWYPGLEDLAGHFGDGSFDWAAIPIGAYTPNDFLRPQHMNPAEAVRMYRAVGARQGLPIHWGTFMLTHEPVLEPRELLVQECTRHGAEGFTPWLIGETRS